ncbi:MAG: peptidylprolyl isomerase [Candidatus Krumholzibacteriia bacterium]
MANAKQGDRVKIHYTGRLKDGTVFDTSEGREPLEFTAGSEELITGVSHAVIGMEEGQERTITVPPEEGFGERREDLAQEVPRDALPQDVKVGEPLTARSGEQEVRVWVRELSDDSAVVDANHPLAGHTLEFDVKVVGVEEPAD